MRNRVIIVSVTILLVLITAGMLLAGKPAPPPPPCTGSPIDVFDQDRCGRSMWIRVNDSTTVCNIICWITKARRGSCPLSIYWIGGTVIADPGQPNGFRFDPNTIVVAEITAEGMQTNICQIAAAPDRYNGGLWYIPASLTQYRAAQ